MVVNINNNNSKEDLEQLLRNKDNDLFANYSKERYQLISKRWKWILYLNQWLHVKRRYYYDKDKKENVYLLDESLGIKKYQHISDEDKEFIFEMASINKMTFRQIKKAFRNCISTCTVHNLIKKHIPKIYVKSIVNPELYPFIFIDIDDTWLNLRINNKKCKFRLRIVHFYQYYDSEQKHFINETKMVILTQHNAVELNDKNWMMDKINDVIDKNYGDRSKFHIFVGSDGARDLKLIAQYFNATHGIDKYHVLNRIWVTFRSQQLKLMEWMLNDSTKLNCEKRSLCKPIIKLVKETKIEEALELLGDIKKNCKSQCYQLNSLVKYLRNNIQSIKTWNNLNYKGTYTETYVQQLVKSYFGNLGRCYSKDNFIKMLKSNCLVAY